MAERGDDSLGVEVVEDIAGIRLLEADYERLLSAIGNALPFATHQWHISWCRRFLDRHPGIIDRPEIHVARERDGRCVAIIPFIRTERRVYGFTIASLSFLGADPAITEIRGSLVLPGSEERVAVAVSRTISSRRDWDWIDWNAGVDAFAVAMARARSMSWQTAASSHVLDLPASWELLRASLKRNIRESLRHCYNSLEREGHRFDVHVASHFDEVEPALDKLFELHSMRANMRGTVAHTDRFKSPLVRSFLREVCGMLAARGSLRIFQLRIADAIVASRIAFVEGNNLYLYYSGFDPSWARYSVMTTLVAEAIKYAIAAGLQTVNLSPGTDVSKTRWGARQIPQQVAFEHSGRLRSRLLRHASLKARSGSGIPGWLLRHWLPGRRRWN